MSSIWNVIAAGLVVVGVVVVFWHVDRRVEALRRYVDDRDHVNRRYADELANNVVQQVAAARRPTVEDAGTFDTAQRTVVDPPATLPSSETFDEQWRRA